jgi:hypothetical protein
VLETTTVDKLPVVLRPSYADAKPEQAGWQEKNSSYLRKSTGKYSLDIEHFL